MRRAILVIIISVFQSDWVNWKGWIGNREKKKIIEKSSNTLRAKSFNLMRYMHDPIGSAFELDATQSNFIVHQKFHQKFSSLCICVRVWHFKEEDLLRNSRSIGLFATSYKHLTNELLFILIFLPIFNLKYCFKSKNKQTATNIWSNWNNTKYQSV